MIYKIDTYYHDLNNLDIKKKLIELNTLYLNSIEKVAYYYEDINTGSCFSYNENTLFYSASSIKVLVCLYILNKKEINLSDKILIKNTDLKSGTGIIKKQNNDTYYTILELIRLTIVESDNTAYIKLVNLIGKDNLINYGLSLGAKHPLEGHDLFGVTNCHDLIIIWKKLHNFIQNDPLGPTLHDYLSNPSFNIIDTSILDNNNYVKKYGSYDVAYHEAGYVEDENPFYLIILTQKNKLADKNKFINESTKKIYNIHKLIHQKKA